MSADLLREYVTLVVEKIRTKKGQKGVMGDKFDLQRFKSLPDQRSMLAYASKFLQRLDEGKGSSRSAFLLSSKYALKIALNEKGVGQNESELDTFTSSKGSPLIAKVYGADEKNRWLIVDLVQELSDPKQFAELAKTDWDDFTATVYDWLGKKATKTMKPDGFTQSVIKFGQEHNLLPGDIEKIEHWGKTPDGRVVLLDYGLTRKVWDTHYKDNQMPQAKSAASDARTSVPGKASDTNKDVKTSAPARSATKAVPSHGEKTAAPKKNPVPQEEPKTVAPQKRAVGDGGTKPTRYRPEDDEKTRR